MDWKYLFTSYEGRISRQPFWLSNLVLIVACCVLMFVVTMVVSSFMGGGNPVEVEPNALPSLSVWHWMLLLLAIPLYYAVYAIYAKRWHDRDKSGWWSLIGFIPIVGVWMIIECGFLRGTEGPNQYGNDPLA